MAGRRRGRRRLHGTDYALRRAWATLARILELWDEEWLLRQIELEFSDRMTSSLGYCDLLRWRIRLSDELRQVGASGVLHEVVCHEAAHLVAHVRWGPRIRPHGPEWASLLDEAGLPARARVPLVRGGRFGEPGGTVLRKIDSRRLAKAACRNAERARTKNARARSKKPRKGRRR